MWAIETHATIDFETYSAAGFVWDDASQSWKAPTGATKKGISAVGTVAYAEHPTTEVITLSYRLPGGELKRWQPGMPAPQDLFDHIAAGGLVEAHNWLFEFALWHYVCRRLYGWPALPMHQMRCSAAKARVNNLPGALDSLTAVLPTTVKKNPDGKRLINKFSVPQKPTKKQPATRIHPHDDPEDAEIVAQIIELIDTRVRPQVANDGGDIIYRGFDKGVVSLQMQGACSGCPSSTATLKNGIESLLKYYVPEVTEVRAV